MKNAKKMVQRSNIKVAAGTLLPKAEKEKLEFLDGRVLVQPQQQQGNLFL